MREKWILSNLPDTGLAGSRADLGRKLAAGKYQAAGSSLDSCPDGWVVLGVDRDAHREDSQSWDNPLDHSHLAYPGNHDIAPPGIPDNLWVNNVFNDCFIPNVFYG